MGSKVVTEQGEGVVTNVDILKQTYQVDVPKVGLVEVKVDENN